MECTFNHEWNAIGRESALACNLIGMGVTNLGVADYTNLGNYYVAFFGLSIGIERLAKLSILADLAIKNRGSIDLNSLKKYGHNLKKLIKKCEGFANEYNMIFNYRYEMNPISEKIIACLDAFADAKKGRYANFDIFSNPELGEEEPICIWWNEVAEFIIQNQKKAHNSAKLHNEVMSPSYTFVVNEQGESMSDIYSATYRMRGTKTVQKYGRFYTLIVIRWLAEILCSLAQTASLENDIQAFYGLEEHYRGNYIVDDQTLKKRKTWPILQNY